MRVIIDTNVLIRFLVHSTTDAAQSQVAADLFHKATEVIIPTHVLCELVWVLASVYKLGTEQIQTTIHNLLHSEAKIILKEDEVEAGLRMMQRGGDFADGVNAYTGHVMARGRAVFASFDKQAVRLLTEQGINAMVPS